MIPLLRECLAFGAAVARFSGRRGVAAAILVGLGAALEGFGILLLVPLLTILFEADTALGGSVTGRLSAWLPPELDRFGRLALLLALFAAVMLLRAFILWRRDSLLGLLQVAFVEDQRALLARRLGAARWPTLARLGHGRVTHLMGGDIQRIGAGVQFLFQSGVSAVVLAGQAAVAFLLSPALALVAIGLMLLGALVMSTLLQKSSDIGRLLTHANLSLMTSAGQFLAGIKVAMSQNIQHHFVAHFERQLTIAAGQQTSFIRQQALLRVLWSLLGAGIGGVTILAGYGLLHLAAPVLIAILIVLARISGPASQIQLGVQQIAYSLAAWDAVTAMDRELAEAASPPGGHEQAPWPQGPICVEHVVFRHFGADRDEPSGLVDVGLTIEPGEIIGLTGTSGAGKTTLADLLCGLLIPQSGRIVIAGVALTEENAPLWQERIAYVAQDPVLFNEGVRENLLWANPRDAAAIDRALAVAGADRVVERLPLGLDTIVGERGALISGGERQRLALARALLRAPAFLILDEATNAIDVEGEAEILMRLRALSPRPAVLMIAHRRESLRFCDRVLHISKGRLMMDKASTTPKAPASTEPGPATTPPDSAEGRSADPRRRQRAARARPRPA
jgi:ATP-binding cassette subfamily C protein